MLCWANNEEFVTSIHTGSFVYLAVTEGQGPSEREPGFYTRKGNDWQVAFPGTIMPDVSTGPVLFQLQISKSDKKAQTLALIDGYVTIISQITNPESENTFMVIGGVQHPLIHPVTGTPIFLPPLDSTEKVRIHEVRYNGYSIIYMSVQLLGEIGYTFAFRVLPMQGEVLRIDSPLTLLHEGFLDIEELEVLANFNEKEYAPSTIVGNYLVRTTFSEFSQYRELLLPWKENITSSLGFKENPVTLINILTHESKMLNPPTFELPSPDREEIYKLVQVINLKTAEKYLAPKVNVEKHRKPSAKNIIL
ncbi:MAG: hypothetical protein KDD40_04115, partial [Bdellovibrionales bacterium]|nr:hypothetical protein [Bdellovibrionales bacterium]